MEVLGEGLLEGVIRALGVRDILQKLVLRGARDGREYCSPSEAETKNKRS